MKEYKKFYINGQWVSPAGTESVEVINPCNEEVIAHVAMGNTQDVDDAVEAARKAFPSWSKTPVSKRVQFLSKISEAMAARQNELGDTIALEMGMPAPMAAAIGSSMR